MAADKVTTKTKASHEQGLFEEDDEFEEFPVEGLFACGSYS